MRIPPGRVAVPIAVLFTIAVAACGSDNKPSTSTASTPVASTPTSISPATTTSTTIPSTSTTAPRVAPSIAVWPTPASTVRYSSPTAVAHAFALDYLQFVSPIVGTFQQGDTRSGEVPIRTTVEGTSLGPVTTVGVRQIDNSWWVLGAATPNIKLVEPAALSTITSPVRLLGTSTAFEGTVNVSVREDDGAKPLAESFVMGGANGQMGPFNASVAFSAPARLYGAITLYTRSAANGHVAEATVIRVRFPAT